MQGDCFWRPLLLWSDIAGQLPFQPTDHHQPPLLSHALISFSHQANFSLTTHRSSRWHAMPEIKPAIPSTPIVHTRNSTANQSSSSPSSSSSFSSSSCPPLTLAPAL